MTHPRNAGFEVWLWDWNGWDYCVTSVNADLGERGHAMERLAPADAYQVLQFDAITNCAGLVALVSDRYDVRPSGSEFGLAIEAFLRDVGDFLGPFAVWRSKARYFVPGGVGTQDPTDLAELEPPAQVEEPPTQTTWFEVRACDELGEPLEGVTFALRVDGFVHDVATDGQGTARQDGAETSFATARIANEADLREKLTALWDQVREGEWLDPAECAEHTFISYREPLPSVALKSETPHTVVFLPMVSRARLAGGVFETNKAFVMPAALGAIKRMVALYDAHPRAALVVVGHTDTTGTPDYNDTLSLERADTVKAFLTDDVDAWLAWWGTSKPSAKRWGDLEDRAMLDAVSLNLGLFNPTRPVHEYQALRGLEDDGIIGPNTRRQLVTDYMATDGTTLPEGIVTMSHGCGESFPLADDGETLDVAAPDNEDDPMDRRVELYFFDHPLGVLPRADDRAISNADSGPYPQWRKRAKETADFVVRRNRRLAVKAVDEATQGPIEGAKVSLALSDDTGKAEAATDAFGVVVFDDVEPGAYKIGVGTEAHSSVSVDHSVSEADDSSSVTVPLATVVGALVVTVQEDGADVMKDVDVRIDGPASEMAVTDGAGEAVFDPLPAGDYEVQALRSGFDLVKGTVTVVGDSTTPLLLKLVSTGPQKYELEELVESVTRGGKLGTVKGATKGSKHFGSVYERKDKAGSAYKQYVNIDKDTEGTAKRLPEQGRAIDLWAKLSWVSGKKTKSLAGKTVKWTATLNAHASAGRPSTFKVDAEKPGFGGTNGKLSSTSTTDKEGWAKITFHLSQYAGDEFVIGAEVDSSDSEATAKPAIKSKPYVVWRKFWYQTTKAHGSSVPTPTDSIAAYKKVGADMLAANTTTFSKTDSPAPPPRTFYPKGMTQTGSSAATAVVIIGNHNRTWFWGKATTEKTRPVKGHLIICDGQWDPSSTPSSAQKFRMTAKTQEVTLNLGANNAGILKPALKGKVLVAASWNLDASWMARYLVGDPTLPPMPAKMLGTLDDSNVTIPLPRTALNKITITLPNDAPDPAVYKIFITLKVGFGKFFAGESKGLNMLIKYDGSQANYFQVVSHEFGHGFEQVPEKPAKRNSTSLAVHPKQYDQGDNHGGQGSHCSTGTTLGAVAPGASAGVYNGGTCIMYHRVSPGTCTQTFCADCEPHLRLEPMLLLKKAP